MDNSTTLGKEPSHGNTRFYEQKTDHMKKKLSYLVSDSTIDMDYFISIHYQLYSPRGIIWSTSDHHYYFVGTTLTPNTMKTTLHTISTSNYEVLQHATIAGYDLAYNKLRKMRKTTIASDGTKTSREFTVLTLVHKSRNGARAYLNHFTDGE